MVHFLPDGQVADLTAPFAAPARIGLRTTRDRRAASAPWSRCVLPGSVAEATKLKAGDKIVRAAGFSISNTGELIEVISRQAPGTWLPLTIERDGKPIELIAKFTTKTERKS